VLGPVVWLAAAALVLMLFIGPQGVANDQAATAKGSIPYAQALFVTNCGSCHTLSAAGTSGVQGPNLDGLGLSSGQVDAQVTSGGPGMPSFSGTLDPGQIKAISDYVAQASAP
jgi:mono/diheme cytochrome c family protein